MCDLSVRRILHGDVNLRPYTLQTVHSLSDGDEEVRLQFCRHFQGILTDNPDLPTQTSDERRGGFSFSWHNFRYWSAANPHKPHQRPIYDGKFTVCCVVWSRGVTGLYFFEDKDGQANTVTSQR